MIKRINLKTKEDYLEGYRKIEELLESPIEWGESVTNSREAMIEAKKKGFHLLDQEVKVKGASLLEAEKLALFEFYSLKKFREEGLEWKGIVTLVIDRGTMVIYNLLLLLEIESGKSIEELKPEDLGIDKETMEIIEKEELIGLGKWYLAFIKVAEAIDSGSLYEDLLRIDLKELFPKDPTIKEEDLVRFIYEYFYGYGIPPDSRSPIKPKHIVEILEAPRELEFKLKESMRNEGLRDSSFRDLARYILTEDAQMRFIKKDMGEETSRPDRKSLFP